MPAQNEPHGELAKSPKELLATLDNISASFDPNADGRDFFQALSGSQFGDVQRQCDLLLKEAAQKGYAGTRRRPPTYADLQSIAGPSSFFAVTVSQGPSNGRIKIGSFRFDHADGTRAYLDVNLRTDGSSETQSFATLSLTNLWSDQPEVIKKLSSPGFRFNNENRFFVDVAQAVPRPGLTVLWYRYWWFDSHHHAWWWYGPYWWWWWRYRWYRQPWWWWWNWWWPWWHWHHWWGWSTWWADLSPIHAIGDAPVHRRNRQ